VTGGKPIGKLLISLVAFYNIERKEEVDSFVLSHTPHEIIKYLSNNTNIIL
jgi:hypothetical protein